MSPEQAPHVVTYWPDLEQPHIKTIVLVPGDKDPFALLAHIFSKLTPVASPSTKRKR